MPAVSKIVMTITEEAVQVGGTKVASHDQQPSNVTASRCTAAVIRVVCERRWISNLPAVSPGRESRYVTGFQTHTMRLRSRGT